MANLLGTNQTHTQIYSHNLAYRLRPNVALKLEHLVPHDASSHFISCVNHVILPKAINQRKNDIPLWQILAKITYNIYKICKSKSLKKNHNYNDTKITHHMTHHI